MTGRPLARLKRRMTVVVEITPAAVLLAGSFALSAPPRRGTHKSAQGNALGVGSAPGVGDNALAERSTTHIPAL